MTCCASDSRIAATLRRVAGDWADVSAGSRHAQINDTQNTRARESTRIRARSCEKTASCGSLRHAGPAALRGSRRLRRVEER